jgi:hypothetical protein
VTKGTRDQNQGVGRVSVRAAVRLAWLLGLLSVALISAAVVLLLLNRPTRLAEDASTWGSVNVSFIVGATALAFALVGTLVASRLPGNPIGWISLAVGLCLALSGVASEYAIYALLSQPGSLSGAKLAAWLGEWTWVPSVGLMGPFLILLFPDGHVPSRRWRVVAWLAATAMIFSGFSLAFLPGPLKETPGIAITNPFGIEATRSILELVGAVGFFLLPFCFVASAVSMVLRFRHSRGVERQQLKWFVSAAALLAATFTATVLASFFVGDLSGRSAPSLALKVAQDITTLTFAGLPVAAGIAILRYRLYEIDLLINRALVYGPLTATLALVYVGSVVGLQYILRTLTGQESTLAVVASTLAIAALFNPLRRRVQGFVDRRFYRRKYDAAKTLAAFNARLRDETELDALSSDVVGVVREAIQPEHVSLWVRPDTATRGEQAD